MPDCSQVTFRDGALLLEGDKFAINALHRERIDLSTLGSKKNNTIFELAGNAWKCKGLGKREMIPKVARALEKRLEMLGSRVSVASGV